MRVMTVMMKMRMRVLAWMMLRERSPLFEGVTGDVSVADELRKRVGEENEPGKTKRGLTSQ